MSFPLKTLSKINDKTVVKNAICKIDKLICMLMYVYFELYNVFNGSVSFGWYYM